MQTVARTGRAEPSLAETVSTIHEQGGLAVLARPFEPAISPLAGLRHFHNPPVLIKIGMDAIETVNAGAFTPGAQLDGASRV